jgi:rhodopsin domain-containing protein
MTKLSILFFYLRIFDVAIFPKLRTAILITIGVVSAAGITFCMTMAFQCTPVDSFWNFLEYNERGQAMHCIDVHACGWVHGAVTLALDLWLMALPMPALLNLTLPRRKKIQVCLMFAVGGL